MFDTWAATLIAKHADSGVLVDSNLLFVYTVAGTDRSLVSQVKGTREYTLADADLLNAVLQRFRRIVTTPHVLTEVSNLIGRCGYVAPALHDTLRLMVSAVLEENHLSATVSVEHPSFLRLGLTDATIAHLADGGPLVISNDLDLSIYLESLDIDCLHYDRVLRPLTFEDDLPI